LDSKSSDEALSGLLDLPDRYLWTSVGICPIPGCGATVTHSLWGDIVNYMCSHCFYFWSEPTKTGVYAEVHS
jgi:hypothetical protein